MSGGDASSLYDYVYSEGPLLSALSHRRVRLGQRTQEEGGRTPGRRGGGPSTRRSGPAPSGDGPGERRVAVSLADLIGAGLIVAGVDEVSVSYKGATHSATLAEDGSILYDGKRYTSASSFSIHIKRLLTPDKQGDDGWKSVAHRGRILDEYRQEFRDAAAAAEGAAAAASGGGSETGDVGEGAGHGDETAASPEFEFDASAAERGQGGGLPHTLPPSRLRHAGPSRPDSALESRADAGAGGGGGDAGSDGDADDASTPPAKRVALDRLSPPAGQGEQPAMES